MPREEGANPMRGLAVLGATIVLTACGGQTNGGERSDAGSGGSPTGSGGSPTDSGGSMPTTPCANPVPEGTPCSQLALPCTGVCINSWQAENECVGGRWHFTRTVACGPDADHAPQCANSFGGGELTPCCADGKLDCSDKADGYPGFACTPGPGSFCSCTCSGGAWLCGC